MPIVYRRKGTRYEIAELPVVEERPLTLIVNGRELATLLCTPVQLDCLVLGFLRFERFIEGLDEVADLLVYPEEGWADVRLTHGIVQPKRTIYTSGCTGGLTFSLDLGEPSLGDREGPGLDPDLISPLMHQLYTQATLYRRSRGIHAAGLAEGKDVLLVAEDVGRHNAIDKIQGAALLRGIPTEGKILLSTGRISSEMLRKGARMGTPFILSRTSPTHLAVEGAKRLGITLIGYVRGDGFNLYSHPERLTSVPREVRVGSPLA